MCAPEQRASITHIIARLIPVACERQCPSFLFSRIAPIITVGLNNQNKADEWNTQRRNWISETFSNSAVGKLLRLILNISNINFLKKMRVAQLKQQHRFVVNLLECHGHNHHRPITQTWVGVEVGGIELAQKSGLGHAGIWVGLDMSFGGLMWGFGWAMWTRI